jgi:exopolysaccharide biosynthesis protein
MKGSQAADVSAYEASQGVASETTTVGSSAATVTDTSYTSDGTNIGISKVSTGSGDSTVTYYVADVVLDDATTLKSAFANDSFGENITETTSAIAAAHDAVFAINGDYYGFRDTGIVIRNGVVYRDEGARQGLAFYRDGTGSSTMYFNSALVNNPLGANRERGTSDILYIGNQGPQ